MELRSDRLVLKPHRLKNLMKIHAWQNKRELLQLNADSVIFQSRAETRKALERWIETSQHAFLHLAIHLRDGGELIGFAQIAFIDDEHRRCKIGLTIGESRLWGRGYGTEAIRRMVAYCFTERGFNRVAAEVYEFNTRAIRAFAAAGFRREGVLRENVVKDGRYVDEHLFGLLRSEWREGLRPDR